MIMMMMMMIIIIIIIIIIHGILGLNFDSYPSKFSTADGRFIHDVPHLGKI
jgi:hypothetical protein